MYYLIDLSEVVDANLENLIDALNLLDIVELAYPLGTPEPAVLPDEVLNLLNREVLSHSFIPSQSKFYTGNYFSMQTYLFSAPLGIDAEWAWGLMGGTGNDVKYIDIENDWKLSHLDLGNEFIRLPSDYTEPEPTCDGNGNCDFGANQNHGTAVLGVISSISDGIGTTGIAVDAGYGVCRQVDYGTIADCINESSSYLNPGDIIIIEAHDKGPACGEPCPCNCGQFEYVPMEYWQENFDAIKAAVAMGRIVVEAGGNGSMNLDHSCYYGLFNRNVRDSGAILVGAGDSFPPHNVSCFSNYGSRIDLYGYGDGVVTLGYGDLNPGLPIQCGQNNINCDNFYNQLYTATFSGTSSASPIVAGAAAIMQGVSKAHNRTLSPLEMRDFLQINGTERGSPLDHNIGKMPNLRGSLRPDLTPDLKFGWYDIIVPPSANDANCNNVTLPSTLPGFVPGTYLNALGINSGVYKTSSFWNLYSVDGIQVGSTFHSNVFPLEEICENNLTFSGFPLTVKGGRHTLLVNLDFANAVDEWYENNNWYARQYVWSPYELTNHSQVVSSAPPDRDTTLCLLQL